MQLQMSENLTSATHLLWIETSFHPELQQNYRGMTASGHIQYSSSTHPPPMHPLMF